jgi:hypothetical protein
MGTGGHRDEQQNKQQQTGIPFHTSYLLHYQRLNGQVERSLHNAESLGLPTNVETSRAMPAAIHRNGRSPSRIFQIHDFRKTPYFPWGIASRTNFALREYIFFD